LKPTYRANHNTQFHVIREDFNRFFKVLKSILRRHWGRMGNIPDNCYTVTGMIKQMRKHCDLSVKLFPGIAPQDIDMKNGGVCLIPVTLKWHLYQPSNASAC